VQPGLVLPGGPQQGATPVPPSSAVASVQVQEAAAGAPVFGSLNLSQPVDRTVSASNLNPNAAAERTSRAPTAQDLNALPATAAGRPDFSGFPVERVSAEIADQTPGSSAGLAIGGHRLFVYHGIPDMALTADGSGSLRVPQDAFAHTDPSAIVHLEAQLASGL